MKESSRTLNGRSPARTSIFLFGTDLTVRAVAAALRDDAYSAVGIVASRRLADRRPEGKYKVSVRLTFHGPLTDEPKKRIHAAVERCPVAKLMTTSEVVIETAPLEAGGS